MTALLLLGACVLQPMDPEAPCEEAGYAIARRTLECTGDTDLANERYLLFEEQTVCIPVEWNEQGELTSGPGANTGTAVVDVFHCAFVIGEIPCEHALQYGDDIAAWLSVSQACAYVVAPAEPD